MAALIASSASMLREEGEEMNKGQWEKKQAVKGNGGRKVAVKGRGEDRGVLILCMWP